MGLRRLVGHGYRSMNRQVDIAPLAVLRVLFGALMAFSTVRFMAKGWVTELFVTPVNFFTYYGFGWVRPLGETGIWAVHIAMVLLSLGIMLGLAYRFSVVMFLVLFTYVELIDVTNYLNHYYFIILCTMLLAISPAGRAYSVDVLLFPQLRRTTVPFWTIGMFRLQMGILYVHAGIAKLNPDWLFNAQPLTIWFVSFREWPIVGHLFTLKATAFVFSWAGALYDLTIPFLLLWHRTRIVAYMAVIGFHVITWVLFPQIGMFPWIMMLITLLFFPISFHRRLVNFFNHREHRGCTEDTENSVPRPSSLVTSFLVLFFAIQILLPWRFMLYPGDLYWTEQGYRFSWRVMLMEKNGYAQFKVSDPATGRTWDIHTPHYLTAQQEKMMSTQPDLILQFAHILDAEFRSIGVADPVVTADVQVSLNGRRSRPFIDPTVDLSSIKDSWGNKEWILPFSAEKALGQGAPDQGYHSPQQGYPSPDRGHYSPGWGLHSPDRGYHSLGQGYHSPDQWSHFLDKWNHSPDRGCSFPYQGSHSPDQVCSYPYRGCLVFTAGSAHLLGYEA